jgi:hypothetical protein
MKCDRCSSLMVEETYYDQGDRCTGLRCLLCGEVVDPVILKNRAESLGKGDKGKKPV